MNDQNNIVPFGHKTDNEWKEYLKSGQQHTADSILEFAKRVAEYKSECDTVPGGTEFSKNVSEWLNMTRDMAVRWSAIGDDSRLCTAVHKLPPSMSTIYTLTTLDDKKFKKAESTNLITPQLTRAKLTAFKRSFNPPLPKPEKPKAGDVDGIHKYLSTIFSLLPPDITAKIKPKKGEIPSFTYQGLLVSRKKVTAAVDALTRKQASSVVDVFIDILAYQEKAFDIIQKERKTKANKSLEIKLKAELQKQKEKTEKITKENVVLPQFAFSKEETKLIRSCLHPDRECTPERKEKAFNAFQRLFK